MGRLGSGKAAGSGNVGVTGERTRPNPLARLALRPTVARAMTVGLVLVLVGSAIADIVAPNRATLLPLVFVPLLGGAALRVRPAMVVASLSALLAAVLPEALVAHDGVQYVRFAAVISVCIASVVTAYLRERLFAATAVAIKEQEAALADRQRVLAEYDSVYQRLLTAKTWHDLGNHQNTSKALEAAMARAAELLDDRLDELGEPHEVIGRSPDGVVVDLEDDSHDSQQADQQS